MRTRSEETEVLTAAQMPHAHTGTYGRHAPSILCYNTAITIREGIILSLFPPFHEVMLLDVWLGLAPSSVLAVAERRGTYKLLCLMFPCHSQHKAQNVRGERGWEECQKGFSPTCADGYSPCAQCGAGIASTFFPGGWRLNHFPGQPVPMLDNPLGEEKFPNIQSKPPLAQLEAISSCPITCYLEEETDPYLSTTSFQREFAKSFENLSHCQQALSDHNDEVWDFEPEQNKTKHRSTLDSASTAISVRSVKAKLRAPSNLTLNRFQGWGIYHLSGQPVPVFHHPYSKKLFLISSLNLPSFSLKPRGVPASDNFCGPPLDPLQQVRVFSVLRAPELDTVLQVGSHLEQRGRITSLDLLAMLLLMQPRIQLAFWAVSAHCWVMSGFSFTITPKAALNPFTPQPVLILRVAPTQVQDPALGLFEPHEVHMGPLLELVQVPLHGIPSLRRVNHTTQLGVICKLAEEALLIVLCIPCQVQLQLCLGLPDPIPTQPGSIPILFPGYLSLLLPPFDQQVLTQPCWSLAFLSSFLTPGDQELLHSMERVLKGLPALFCSLVPEGSFPGGPISLQPRLPPILMSPISLLALVTNRSGITSPLVGLSITWLKKLSSMHSRSLLDCLQLSVLLFQQMSGWLKSPSRTRGCERDASCSWRKKASSIGSP
ncbi:hypothetical protein QYF61_002210 [Mycteria americana]|uniref:Uncharacterized protein n=1 Tax=Mycteria americana TaxID=33587 RepID=A0AAN7PVH6_MYCAM|nr:hypothetical protein QYF61_002210 [Mycteria americana]